MTCPACNIAAEHPLTGHMTADCPECEERSMAQSLPFFNASRHGRLTTEYTDALAKILRDGETVEEAHKRVKAWSLRMLMGGDG